MEAYNAHFASYPVYASPITFAAVWLLAAAVRETGTSDPDRLVDVVEGRRLEGASTIVPSAEFIGHDEGEKVWVGNAPIAAVTLVVMPDDEADAQDMFLVDQETPSLRGWGDGQARVKGRSERLHVP